MNGVMVPKPKFDSMKKEIHRIALTGSETMAGANNDFTSFDAFEASRQGCRDESIHLAVIGLSDTNKREFERFVRHEFFELFEGRYVYITEAGDVLASQIDGRWSLVHEDLTTIFSKPPIELARVESTADDFIAQQDQKEGSVGPEVAAAVRNLAKTLARLIMKDPTALEHIEWRQLEQVVAEIFGGIGFTVELTRGAKDKGRDVILECLIHGRRQTYIVEVKHWLSKKVVQSQVTKFVKVVLREGRDLGVMLSTYGYAANAFEALTSVERMMIRVGEESKVVSLCRTYMAAAHGLHIPVETLPEILIADTVQPQSANQEPLQQSAAKTKLR
jgi:hypothetical protein